MGVSLIEKYPLNFDFHGKKVLNLGCGKFVYPAENVTNVDLYGNPDIRWDLNRTPWPIADESFDHVIANHVLEHLTDWWPAFCEAARVTKVGGMVEIYVPGKGSDSICGYRDHLHEINNCSFFGIFNNFTYDQNAWCADQPPSPANNMQLVKEYTCFYSEWWIRYAPRRLKSWMATHLRNIIAENGYIFIKKSDEEVNATRNAHKIIQMR